jgi:hypothetical protein
MAVQDYEEHGVGEFQLPGEQIDRSATGLDRCVQDWQTGDKFSFTPGKEMPGYPGMEIVSVQTEEDGPKYLHRVTGEGVLGEKAEKRTRFRTRETLQGGWDGAEAVWITKTPGASKFAKGSSPTGYANLYAFDVDKEELKRGWWEVTIGYLGLISEKPYHRRVTVNEQILSDDAMVVALDPEWDTPRRGEASLAKIVVQDTEITTTIPDTSDIPGNSTPPDPPAIQVISVTGTDLLWHWPYGWKLASIDYEKVPGKSLWLVTYTYEYVWRVTP